MPHGDNGSYFSVPNILAKQLVLEGFYYARNAYVVMINILMGRLISSNRQCLFNNGMPKLRLILVLGIL